MRPGPTPRNGASRRVLPALCAVFLSAVLALAARPSVGGVPEENAAIFNNAGASYASKDYKTALKLYLELIDRGVSNPDLFFNLGNAYFKAGKLGYAVLYFERALTLKPFDRDIRQNLEYTRRSLKEPSRPRYNERVSSFLRAAYSYFKPATVAYLELFFFTLTVAVLGLYVFAPFSRAKTRKHLYACAVLLVLSAAALFWYRSFEKNHPRGILVEREARVLGAPIAESETLFNMYEGTEARLKETRGDWVRVTLSDGREGWMLSRNIVFM